MRSASGASDLLPLPEISERILAFTGGRNNAVVPKHKATTHLVPQAEALVAQGSRQRVLNFMFSAETLMVKTEADCVVTHPPLTPDTA
jgi:hypothetical protein